MTQTIKQTITCDGCGIDISPQVTGFTRLDILILEAGNVALSSKNGIQYSTARRPIIEDNKHFCSIQCVGKWASEQPVSKLKSWATLAQNN